MNSKPILKSLSLVLLLASAASAADLQWIDQDFGDPLDYLDRDDPTYVSDFNLTIDSPPYTLGTPIDNATATFWFADDPNDGSEYYYYEKISIYLNGTLVWGPEDVDGSHTNAPNNYHQVDIQLSQALIDVLEATGKLDYKVQLQSGYKYDTYLKRAQLVANGSTPPASVPDAGATAGLIGTALLGLAAFRRLR